MINKYIIIYSDNMKLLDDNIEIFGKTPKKALEKYIWKTVKRFNASKSNYILWTWKIRIWFIIN